MRLFRSGLIWSGAGQQKVEGGAMWCGAVFLKAAKVAAKQQPKNALVIESFDIVTSNKSR